MRKALGLSVILTAVLFCLSLLGSGVSQAKAEKTVEEEILEILKKEGSIGTEKYEELRKRAEKERIKEARRPQAGFKKGFFLQTPDGKFKLQPYLKLRGQFKAFESGHPGNNDFYMRHARIGLKGKMYGYYDFNLAGEFGKGKSDLWDAYIGFNYFPSAKLRFGQFKQPFSLEWCSPADWRDFVEMPLPIDNLTPDRDIGAMVHGNLGGQLVNYSLAISNGTGKNTSDTNNRKDVAARLVFSPFRDSENSLLKGLHFGGSLTYGNQETKRDEMRRKGKFQTAGGTKFFQFKDVSHDGDRSRYGAELAWMLGSFSLKGEWARMDLDDLEFGAQKDDFDIDGGYVSLSYILTGEKQPFENGKYGRISPKQSFDPKNGTWGGSSACGKVWNARHR